MHASRCAPWQVAQYSGDATVQIAQELADLYTETLDPVDYVAFLDNLNERVLNGLDDTYKSLGVPTGPTVRSIVLLGEVVSERLRSEGVPMERLATVREPFDHMARGLAETNVRQR